MRVAFALAAVLLAPSVAVADGVCDIELDPVEIGLRDSGFDHTRSACTRTSFQTGARATALIATEDFYGTLASSLFTGIRLALPAYELEAGARVVDYRFVQNAVITDAEASMGPVFVGATLPGTTAIDGLPVNVAANLRIDIPATDTGSDIGVLRVAAGVFASVQPEPKWALHARLAVLSATAFPPHAVDQRTAVAMSTDAARRVNSWVSAGGGLEFQSGWHGQGLDHMLAKLAVRFFPGAHRLDVSLAVPVVGAERTNLAVQLGYTRAL